MLTRENWLTCHDPYRMFAHLRRFHDRTWRLTSRKIWLLACATLRQLINPSRISRCCRFLDQLECHPDDFLSVSDWDGLQKGVKSPLKPSTRTGLLAYLRAFPHRITHAIRMLPWMIRSTNDARIECYNAACIAMREIFNPFPRSGVQPMWLAWNDRTLPKLAQGIFDERAFDRLPILADALEDAGCADFELLRHCRERGDHVRGCWAVDLLIGQG